MSTGYFNELYNATSDERQQADIAGMFTTGVVVDTNDPMDIGRLRVCCPAWGDNPDPQAMDVNHLPWAKVCSPFGGFVDQGFRSNGESIDGEVSYGMYSAPKVGAEAICVKLNGDPNSRLILGFTRGKGSANTLPHGRYKVNGNAVDGPFSVDDKPIEPLFSNNKAAFSNSQFGSSAAGSFEWMSRGADYSAGAHNEDTKRSTQPTIDDDGVERTEGDGRRYITTQGSSANRLGAKSELAGDRDSSHDPSTHCWVTPGFHAIAMDDRQGNTRMRFRTSTGHQILLDDTNERIYVATNRGNSWYEMDSNGNVDIYCGLRLNIFAATDINMTAGESIRMSAKDIHLKADNEIRATATADVSVHSNASVRVGALGDVRLQSTGAFHVNTGGTLFVSSVGAQNFDAGSTFSVSSVANQNYSSGASILLTSTGTNEIQAGGNVIVTAPMIYRNSGPAAASAAPAAVAQLAGEQPARHTTRIPQHEPWPRMSIDSTRANMVDEESKPATDGTKWQSKPISYDGSDPSEFEFKSYNDPNIGRMEGGVAIIRNKLWHR